MMTGKLSNHPRYRYYKRIRGGGKNQFKVISYCRRVAARSYCLECVGWSSSEVQMCTESKCPLYPYRFGMLPEGLTPKDRAKSIRAHCLECCCDDQEYIRECPSVLCPVHPYRLPGYRTDMSSLIRTEDVDSFPELDEGIEDNDQKTAV